MSPERLAGSVRGYVEICADGFFCERFLNICMHREIFLWDVRRLGENRICACISIDDFRRLRSVATKTKTRVRITKRVGLPFFLYRYRKRKALLAGCALFFLILWYLSTHIVGIDITGNERITPAEILQELKGAGLSYGVSVKKVDRSHVRNRLMTELDDLAWVGINIKGSRAYIEVKERLDTFIEPDRTVPCDIVAERSGTLKLLEVKNGQTMVKTGQYVEEGDLLVSGVVDSDKVGIRYVHSYGEIYAETIFEKSGEYTLEYIEKIYTGKEKNRYKASVMGKSFNLFLRNNQPFEYSDCKETQREYRLPLDAIPSLFVEERKFLEYVPRKKKRSLEETVKLGEKELMAELDKEVPDDAEITDKKTLFSQKGKNKVEITVKYVCNQDIAGQRTIDKTENLEYDVK